MTPWVIRLIIANAVMFLLTNLRPALMEFLMLVPAYALIRPWTIITYMFLHAGFGHIFFNMLGLFFFGPRLEKELGGTQFFWLYFVSGIAAALVSFVFTPFTAIVGASGAVYGVMLGFAYFWPRERIYVWGIIPVESRIMVLIMTALSLYGGFGGGGDGIAHFAHLGGFVGGFLYLKLIQRNTRAARFEKKLAPSAPTGADLERWMKIQREGLHEVNRAELDRVMGKIKTSGVGTLTPTERTFLDRFSSE